MISIGNIVEQGSDVLVARYQMPHGSSLAMFTGGGLDLAHTLLTNTEQYEIPMMETCHVDLRRLFCRWKPIPATRDEYSLFWSGNPKRYCKRVKLIPTLLQRTSTHPWVNILSQSSK